MIAIPSLTEKHKEERVRFALRFANLEYPEMPNIIFTDEAMVQINLDEDNLNGHWGKVNKIHNSYRTHIQ